MNYLEIMSLKQEGCIGCTGCTKCTDQQSAENEKVRFQNNLAIRCSVLNLVHFDAHKQIMALQYIGCTGCTKCTKWTDLQSVHSGSFSKKHGCNVRRVHWVHRIHRSALEREVCTLMHHLESMAPKNIGCTGSTGSTGSRQGAQISRVCTLAYFRKVCGRPGQPPARARPARRSAIASWTRCGASCGIGAPCGVRCGPVRRGVQQPGPSPRPGRAGPRPRAFIASWTWCGVAAIAAFSAACGRPGGRTGCGRVAANSLD
jgi:hypothetical protein